MPSRFLFSSMQCTVVTLCRFKCGIVYMSSVVICSVGEANVYDELYSFSENPQPLNIARVDAKTMVNLT